MRPGRCCSIGRSSRPLSIGVSVSDTRAETTTETVSVIANSRNSRPTTPVMNSSGMNTATSETVSETMVKPICFAPRNAAVSGGTPCSMKRTMFSIITIASSTTKPVATVSAISERLSRPKPSSDITPNVPISDSGSASAGIRVARSEPRNRKMTSVTSTTENSSTNCTSATEARIVAVRSVTTCSAIPAGIAACSDGSACLIASTVWTMFAPGWRWMSSSTAGMPRRVSDGGPDCGPDCG